MGSVKNELPFDWVMGVTDETIKEGVILEEGYVKGGGLPKFYSGDLDVTFSEDDQPVMNILILEGLLRNTSGNLTFKIYESTGNDTYPILKSGGILQVARTLPSTITEVLSTSSFKIPPQDYLVLERHDARFTENNRGGKFACRIKSNDQLYNANFSISGGTLSLTNISNGDPFPIASLAVGDSFQLTNCFDILEEGLDKNGSTGYPVRGYVIKHDEPANSWVKFNKYDKPNKTTKDAVIVGFYELEDLKRDFLYFEQIDKHGPVTQKEKLDYPITEAELDLIVKNFRKYLEPYRTFKLVTRRPSILQKGTEVFFNLSRYPSGFYKVISNSIDYNHSEGELDGIPFRTQEITFANYENNFAKTIAKLRRKNELEKAKTAENSQERDTQTLILNYTWSPEEEEEITITVPSAPTGLAATWTNTTAELSFSAVSGADSYKVFIYDAGTPISGYNGKVITLTTESVTGLSENKTYTWKVKATNVAGDSAFSSEESFKTQTLILTGIANDSVRNYYYTYKADGTGKTRITAQNTYAEGSNDGWGAISPNGRYFSYSRPTASSTYALFVYDFQTNSEVQVSPVGSATYGYSAWNPADPNFVYCWKNFGTGSSQIVKLSLTPTSEFVLASPAQPCYELDFNADGSHAIARVGSGGIARYNTSTWGAPSFIISGGITGRYNHDFTKILFSKLVSGFYQVHDANIDGTSQTPRTTGSVNKYNPAQQKASPFDITYNYHNGGSDMEIWKMTSSYTGHAVFLDSTGNNDTSTDWALVQY